LNAAGANSMQRLLAFVGVCSNKPDQIQQILEFGGNNYSKECGKQSQDQGG
jgi:hypothetical protein